MIVIKNLRKEKPKENYQVRVHRGTTLGNPFVMGSPNERNEVCNKYEWYFNQQLKRDSKGYSNFLGELNALIKIYEKYGKLELFCWCHPKRCHAETIKNYLEKRLNII